MGVQRIKLRQIADARSGDKGSNANIGVIAKTPEVFHLLVECLSADRVQAYFQPLGVEVVDRYELPNLNALNFVLKGVLGEGGSRSLRLDPQGKALGQILLEMTVEVPMDVVVSPQNSLVIVDYPQEGIAVLTLNRQEKRNALNVPLLESFCSQLENLVGISSIRALVIAAAGPVFCGGMDLNDATAPEKVERSASFIAAMLTALVEAPFVTIAAAQGMAAGGGAGILSACDIVVAGDDLRICYPEGRRGLVPAQVAPLLMRSLPRHLVHELLFLGESFDADRAHAVGLVNKVVPREALLEEAVALARLVLKSAPGAIQQTKWLLTAIDGKTFADDLAVSVPYHHASRHSLEAIEGTRAFLEKRLPDWEVGSRR